LLAFRATGLTMPKLRLQVPPPRTGAELGALLTVAWLAFISIPISLGGPGLSWDALNHHIYLGWTADHPRFDRDFLAASYQSFTYPYLYWPLFKLFQSGINGQWAGAILVTINLLAVPPLWLLARLCVPETSWYGSVMRWLAVVLAFLSGVVLSMFDSTSNDFMAAIPLVWAIALALVPLGAAMPAWLTLRRSMLLSGACAGASVAFKLSNGPLAVLMPLLWLLHGPSLRERFANAFWGSMATLASFLVFYGYWGWQLWTHYGNPTYPFYDPWFAPLRAWLGWAP
jgi:hypothetical protein